MQIDISSPEGLMRRHDWDLLYKQYCTLLRLQHRPSTTQEESDAIEGMLNWIDSTKECAVDYLGIDEDIVYPKRKRKTNAS